MMSHDGWNMESRSFLRNAISEAELCLASLPPESSRRRAFPAGLIRRDLRSAEEPREMEIERHRIMPDFEKAHPCLIVDGSEGVKR
jgi:hypothetical protein